ncbi:MAG: LytTR family DNA-binding domain-containing protein [Burkholderiaceae bacterium]|nr:LytTR family DNA-binding domain-containing protein [Burkholderiaceae bacterium]
MSPPTAVIAEDETNLALALEEALNRVWPELQIIKLVNNGLAVLSLLEQQRPDILFLDIRMPGLTGLQVATQLMGSAKPLIVFVTAYDEYAVQAFEQEAVDYLVKPINDTRLFQTMERLKKRLLLPQSSSSSIELHRALSLIEKLSVATKPGKYLNFLRAGLGEKVRIIPIEEITHLQAQDKYVSIYTSEGEDLIRISLKELADQLDPAIFVQVHRATIVNMRAVLTAERDFTGRMLLSLKAVPNKVAVSRQYAHLFARM